jgi:secreted PhoX family phosphatase
VNLEGDVSTLAGRAQGFQDGTADNAMFNSPEGLAIDRFGQIYVADRGNNRIRIITTAK